MFKTTSNKVAKGNICIQQFTIKTIMYTCMWDSLIFYGNYGNVQTYFTLFQYVTRIKGVRNFDFHNNCTPETLTIEFVTIVTIGLPAMSKNGTIFSRGEITFSFSQYRTILVHEKVKVVKQSIAIYSWYQTLSSQMRKNHFAPVPCFHKFWSVLRNNPV